MFLEHVNLSVSDLQRSVAFYRQLFGFKVRWEGTITGDLPAAHVGDDQCYLALFQAEDDERAQQDYTRVGINHFGSVVDDLGAMKARLAELGITPHLEGDYEPGRRLYFLDLDGVEVELVEYDQQSS